MIFPNEIVQYFYRQRVSKLYMVCCFRILTTKTISRFKEAVEQETRKENTRKRRGFCDVVKTHKFKSLKTMQGKKVTVMNIHRYI